MALDTHSFKKADYIISSTKFVDLILIFPLYSSHADQYQKNILEKNPDRMVISTQQTQGRNTDKQIDKLS